MKNFQVHATFEGGAMVLFGVTSGDGEDGALLEAADRLARFPQKASHVQVIELPGRCST